MPFGVIEKKQYLNKKKNEKQEKEDLLNGWKRLPVNTNEKSRNYGKKILEKNFEGKYTLDKIRKIANKFSESLSAKGVKGLIAVPLQFSTGKWAGGKLTDIGDDVELYDPSDSINGDLGDIIGFKLYIVI